MKMNFKFLALAAAALTFAACTDELVQTPEQVRNNSPESNAISFSTYMGNRGNTRAGQAGSYDTKFLQGFKHDGTGWSETQAKAQGFGVFGYYTGKNTYGAQQGTTYTGETNPQANIAANFMFNQLVWWNDELGNDFITKWTYSPVKYWPNEVQSGRVDDQDNDAANNTATTDYTKGGNVSFFAYAPYVSSLTASETSGITKINGKSTLTGAADAANAQPGDPILTYVVAADGKDIVDLLWGTYKGTDLNVNNAGNASVQGTNSTTAPLTTHSTYVAEILYGYKTNADLTKQKTNGTVGFAFKHALAKVGGSTTNPDPSNTEVKNGLMVVLDIDDMKGAEVGGDKDASTKVTVKEVIIKAKSLVDDGSKHPGEDNYKPTYLKKAQGDLNLATGTWTILRTENTVDTDPYTGAAETTATINQSGSNASGTLNATIAEPTTLAKTEEAFNGLVAGVLTTPKNVYEDEAAPLVFIPGTYPELTISIDYIVRTADENLTNHYSEVEQVITKKLTFTNPVQLNKQYSILMHLGLTSVKFTAEVSDWDVYNDNPNFDSDGDGNADIKVEDVWLPRNVGSLVVRLATDKVASDGESLALTSAKWYNDSEHEVNNSISTIASKEPSTASWLQSVGSGSFTLTKNTTFADRTAMVTLSYTTTTPTVTYTSEPFAITQYGRIPANDATINVTWTTEPATGTVVKNGVTGVSYEITSATVDKYCEVSASGVAGSVNNSSVSLSDRTDVDFSKLVFIDQTTGAAASWITVSPSTKKLKVDSNNTTTERKADMYLLVNGKLLKTNKTITQTGTSA